ncbi:hypothetical protein H0Z60_10225 [Ectothiorhodospiraceae bacterium WFHF3C12]|nr:hypothetical protein [Ectothiorhodospiraceae bacterium WFHF3C12]
MKVPYSNDKPHPVHVGGKLIMPGDTREVDESLIPRTAPAEPVEPVDPGDPLLALLDGSVKEVTDALPGLDDDQVRQLRAAEESGKTRSTLIAAIDETLLERAQARTGEGQGDGAGEGQNGEGGGES